MLRIFNLFIFFVSLSSITKAQQDNIVFSLKISGLSNKSDNLVSITIFADNASIKTFIVSRDTLINATLFRQDLKDRIVQIKSEDLVFKKTSDLLGNCIIYVNKEYYFSIKIPIENILLLKQDTIKKNFYFSQVTSCTEATNLKFKYNSLTFDTLEYNDIPDSLIKCMASKIFRKVKQFPLNIYAHSGLYETDPIELSYKRANILRDKLIYYGFPKDLIIIKPMGKQKPYVDAKTIQHELKENKTADKFEIDNKYNVRCYIGPW